MRRLILTSVLALVALAAVAATASASTPAPVITSVSPSQVAVGQTLVIHGKNFKKGVKNNRVFFKRASDGKTVRARPTTASSSRRMTVVIPDDVTPFLTITNGVAQPTLFQIQVLSGKFSKALAKSKSPTILPKGTTPTPGTPGAPGGPTVAPADCDNDGVPNSQDSDDDNDGLPDTLEAQIGTDPCKADTDGDGVSDAFEYYSALDLNGSNLPYAGKKPYPNPLDGSDANKDFDGDGMTQAEEYAAWVYGGHQLPAGPGQSFPYSDGNQMSPAGNGSGAMDLNQNGRITDEEKDADSDGLPNWVELAKGEPTPSHTENCDFKGVTDPEFAGADPNIFTDCGLGRMPNGNTFAIPASTVKGSPAPPFLSNTNYLDPDTDGDGVPDGADDQDHDGLSNIEEITVGSDTYFTDPQDPCDPNPESPTCPTHPSHL
jgi:hypothetical protein